VTYIIYIKLLKFHLIIIHTLHIVANKLFTYNNPMAREQKNMGVGDTELGKIAEEYLFNDVLLSGDYLDRMNDQERWFIDILRKLKGRKLFNERVGDK
jgi:hypothetical protein